MVDKDIRDLAATMTGYTESEIMKVEGTPLVELGFGGAEVEALLAGIRACFDVVLEVGGGKGGNGGGGGGKGPQGLTLKEIEEMVWGELYAGQGLA